MCPLAGFAKFVCLKQPRLLRFGARRMLVIDIVTVCAFSMVLSLSLGTLLIWLWMKERTQRALASWGAARLLTAAAMPLLAARGVIPDWLSIVVPNALLCLSFGLVWSGARQFEGRPIEWTAACAGATIWLLACAIPAFYNTLPARVALIATVIALYNLAAAREFYRGLRTSNLPARPVVMTLLAGVGVIVGIAGLVPLMSPFRQTAVGLPSSIWFGFLISLIIGIMAATSILLVALTKEQAELRSTAALAAARDRANEASGQKSRFLARMSHELRTPLNGVLGLAQVLATDPELGERQRQHATTVEQAGQHLLSILNEILDLSRIEAGRMDLAPRPVALAGFLQELNDLAQGATAPLGVMLQFDISPDLPKTVLVDAMRLRQILLNLLNNAWKFTPAGGSVRLAVARVANDRIGFTITDTGPGVPASMRPRLFQDYARGSGASHPGGTGLGLAISAHLASAMGGELTHADGPDGTGSRFSLVIALPEANEPADAETVRTAVECREPPGALRFLIVDDVALNRKTIQSLLEYAGHEVEVAENGRAALAALDRHPLPDIVLMDQSMPDMDGNTAARHIRNLPGRAGRVPILAVTANALPEDIEASLAAGMDGHIAKPIELKVLLDSAARALDRMALC